MVRGPLSLCPLSSSCIKSSCDARPPTHPLASRPVRMDWSTRRVVDLMVRMRISAGTLSPTVDREEEREVSREGSFLPSEKKTVFV